MILLYCAVVALSFVGIAPLNAQKAAPSSLEDVLAKYFEARGGEEKLRALKSAVMRGRALVQGALQGQCVVNMKRPSMLRVELTVQGFTIVQGYDGQTAWLINPLLGATEARKSTKNESKQIAYQADMFDGELLDYKEKGNRVQLLGKENVEIVSKESIEGFAAYKLKVTKKNGDVVTIYLNASTFLPFKEVTKVPTQDGSLEMVTMLKSYRSIGGVMIPSAIDQTLGGKPYVAMTFEKIEVNKLLDDSMFALQGGK